MDFHRRSIRLKGFDCSSNGLCFVTIDLEDKRNWLWEIDNKGGDENRRKVRPMLGNIVQWFKTMTTNEYINNVKSDNWPRFNKRLWQRNYFERIIRNEKEYEAIKKYIRENPINWNTNQKMDLLK